MTESDILQIWKSRLTQLDFAVLIVKDETRDTDMESFPDVLKDLADEGGTVIVFRESVFSDFKKLSTEDLLDLRHEVDEVLRKRTLFSVVGDA